jgi:hypothetical protein
VSTEPSNDTASPNTATVRAERRECSVRHTHAVVIVTPTGTGPQMWQTMAQLHSPQVEHLAGVQTRRVETDKAGVTHLVFVLHTEYNTREDVETFVRLLREHGLTVTGGIQFVDETTQVNPVAEGMLAATRAAAAIAEGLLNVLRPRRQPW